MRKPVQSLVVVIASAWINSACTAEHRYDGDGKFVDRGPAAATERYVVDFGPIDLSRETEAKFRMRNLPQAEFAVGIQLERSDHQRIEPGDSTISATVSMDLKDEQGGTVLQASRPLRDWTWSNRVNATDYFLYVRDPQGSYFTPAKDREYMLTVRVSQTKGSAQLQTNVVMKSGGWK